MAPRKLSDTDKRDVIEMYRQPGETTSTVAQHYGVSTSTISRILKTQIPEDEYRALISQKRSAPSEKPVLPSPKPVDKEPKPEPPVRRVRKRSRSLTNPSQSDADEQLVLIDSVEEAEEENVTTSIAPPILKRNVVSTVTPELSSEPNTHPKDDVDDNSSELDEHLENLDDDLDSDLDSGLDDIDFDDNFDDSDDEFEEAAETSLLGTSVEIMPIADAIFPRTCYLVVDRLSELITHPLKEFAELGVIPAEQESALTLPVFDNHRVARRFSRRNQRVIKVPDGQLITKATVYLQAKGITHLLIDGNIYSLLG